MGKETETDTIRGFFLQEKPSHLLMEINRRNEESYASVLSRKVGCTYSHTVKVLSSFNDMGLIEFNKDGRRKLIELTERGEKIADSMEELVRNLEP